MKSLSFNEVTRYLSLSVFILLCIYNVEAQTVYEDEIVVPIPYSGIESGLFGQVATDGNYLVMTSLGIFDNTGCAYILENDGSEWKTVARLSPSSGSDWDSFGASVCIDDDVVVIGASGDDDVGSNAGAAYVFVKPQDGWKDMTETIKLKASDGAKDYKFGTSVSISDNVIAVGAIGGNGMVYVFSTTDGGWTDAKEAGILTASDGSSFDKFGMSVSKSGDVIAVGAPGYSVIGQGLGKVYIFEKPAGGWTSMTENCGLIASEYTTNREFGQSLSLSGNTIAIGSSSEKVDGSITGAVYICEKTGASWEDMTASAKLYASDREENGKFGYSVCISGTLLLVGSPYSADEGSAYVFERPAQGWENSTETLKVKGSDTSLDDNFGWCCSLAGNKVFIGSPGCSDYGVAYWYVLTQYPALSARSLIMESLHVFPNPAESYISVAVPEIGNSSVLLEITGMDGRIFQSKEFERISDIDVISIGNLPQGAYLLSIEKDGIKYACRFIKN